MTITKTVVLVVRTDKSGNRKDPLYEAVNLVRDIADVYREGDNEAEVIAVDGEDAATKILEFVENLR